MKKNGRRLGRVVRWGVYACTLMFITVVIASYVRVIVFHYEYAYNSRSRVLDWVAVEVYDSRLQIEWHSSMTDRDLQNSTALLRYVRLSEIKSTFFDLKAWSLPSSYGGGHHRGVYYGRDLPLGYPTGALVLVSLVLLIKSLSKRKRANTCPCGYSLEGLTSNTCPECGVERG